LLAAIVFAAHALEDYVNFLGEKIAPERWRNEWVEFRQSGTTGKPRALEEICCLEHLPAGKRPFSTVQKLKGIRDQIAHPRTLVNPVTSTHYREGKEPPLFRSSWVEKFATRQQAERAIADVEEIVRRLHEAACPWFPMLELIGPDPLGGILGMRSTTAHLSTE